MNKTIFYIIFIAIVLATIFLFFKKIISLEVFIVIIVPTIIAWIIAERQISIAKKIADNNEKPVVDVGMIKHKGSNGTRFYFINMSKIPANIWLKIKLEIKDINGRKIEISEKEEKSLINNPRLIGEDYFPIGLYYLFATNFDYLTNLIEKYQNYAISLKMMVFVSSVSNKKRPEKVYNEKEYYYDKKNLEWINSKLGMPDQI